MLTGRWAFSWTILEEELVKTPSDSFNPRRPFSSPQPNLESPPTMTARKYTPEKSTWDREFRTQDPKEQILGEVNGACARRRMCSHSTWPDRTRKKSRALFPVLYVGRFNKQAA